MKAKARDRVLPVLFVLAGVFTACSTAEALVIAGHPCRLDTTVGPAVPLPRLFQACLATLRVPAAAPITAPLPPRSPTTTPARPAPKRAPPPDASLLGPGAVPAPAGQTSRYGIADGNLAATCPTSGCTSTFNEFSAGLGLGYARIGVPYDTFATSSGNECVLDENAVPVSTGGTYYARLESWLTAVNTAGLTPTIALTSGKNPSDPGFPSGATGQADYVCGLVGLLANTSVTQWEAFNEPDLAHGTSLAEANAAADLWYLADTVANEDQNSSAQTETVAALTISGVADATRMTYVKNYLNRITTDEGGSPYAPVPTTPPAVIALHDYEDVTQDAASDTNTVTTNLTNLESAIASAAQPDTNYSIWITETGVHLNDGNMDCCGHTLGADVDGNGLAQAWGAAGFKLLASQPKVTQSYWYEFQTYDNNLNDYDRWDSALVGADNSGGGDGDPAGYALDRPSYCVLAFGYLPSAASSSPSCNDTVGLTAPCYQPSNNTIVGCATAPGCSPPGFAIGPTLTTVPADTDWEDQATDDGVCDPSTGLWVANGQAPPG